MYFFRKKDPNRPTNINLRIMHFINASLAYILFKSLYTAFSIKYAKHIALAGAALFLLSPYQTENVLWAATIHYSIALTFLLVSGLRLQVSNLKMKTLLYICTQFAKEQPR